MSRVCPLCSITGECFTVWLKELIVAQVVLYQSNLLFANNLDRQAHNPNPNDAYFRAHQARSCLLAYSDLNVAERPFLYRQHAFRHLPVQPYPQSLDFVDPRPLC